ncbi:MAG: primosomal replication protein N [Uliginosibacterium sp.]|nr:primosomal replication protein N [Uliginosibacterium sp.]MBK9392516.1 primosomal replication protein N [Uliginosibacterium sp.]MBK9616569.1 primosomal replication protein N [Uliginosibacterium sp.]
MSALTATNTLRIVGQLIARDAVRWTPAKQPVLDCRVEHVSRQEEAGVERSVGCELAVRVIGPLALQFEKLPLGANLVLEGFLNARSAKQRMPVLHIRTFELMEGIHHGF